MHDTGPRGEAAIAYQVNTYRVLLTRARYETVIWVPCGDADDATRQPAEFDAIAEFLAACGAQPQEKQADAEAVSEARHHCRSEPLRATRVVVAQHPGRYSGNGAEASPVAILPSAE